MNENILKNKSSPGKYASGARCLRILGHPVRLRIMTLLAAKEWSVNELAGELGISQSNLSQHLTLLKDREIIMARREGHQVFYGIGEKKVLVFLSLMEELFCREPLFSGETHE
ncbi:MAG: ArsR/SmtB family transcription factor [Leptospirales bacterium]